MAIPFLFPFGLPIPITKSTTDAYNALEGIPDGGVVMFFSSLSFTAYFEISPNDIAVAHHAFKLVVDRGVKIVFVSGSVDTVEILKAILYDKIQPFMQTNYGYDIDDHYGEDWVNLGMIPGQEAALAGVYEDLWEVAAGVDHEGTALSDLPMMADIRDVNDYNYMYCSISHLAEIIARQWGPAVAMGIPVVTPQLSGSVAFAQPFVEKGQISAILNSQRGGAEYEQLVDVLGLASSMMDAQSSTHLYAAVMVVLGMIGTIIGLGRKRGD
jgi:hypothetical protein